MNDPAVDKVVDDPMVDGPVVVTNPLDDLSVDGKVVNNVQQSEAKLILIY